MGQTEISFKIDFLCCIINILLKEPWQPGQCWTDPEGNVLAPANGRRQRGSHAAGWSAPSPAALRPIHRHRGPVPQAPPVPARLVETRERALDQRQLDAAR